jgi:hypothetical protein
VRNFHRHQQGIARFEAHPLTANLGDEFARQDVEPLILLVMGVKRGAAISVVVSLGKYKDCKPSLGVGGTNNLGIEHS